MTRDPVGIESFAAPWHVINRDKGALLLCTAGGVRFGLTPSWPPARGPETERALLDRIVECVNHHDALVSAHDALSALNSARETADQHALIAWVEAHPGRDPNPTRNDVVGWLLDHWLSTQPA